MELENHLRLLGSPSRGPLLSTYSGRSCCSRWRSRGIDWITSASPSPFGAPPFLLRRLKLLLVPARGLATNASAPACRRALRSEVAGILSFLKSLLAQLNVCGRFSLWTSYDRPSALWFAQRGGVPFGGLNLICLHALGGGLLFTFILWDLQPLLTMRSQTFCTSLAYPFPQL